MSQVIRKFEGGGVAPKDPLLIERENVGKYNADELIKNATIGADAWLQSKGIKGAQAQNFKQALPKFIDVMKAGKVKILADGRYDTGDSGLSSSGQYDKKKFLGIKTGKYSDTENNAFNDVGAYMNSLLEGASTYEAPKPAPKERFNPNTMISKEISKRWYGGNKIDMANYFGNRSEEERNALVADIANTADYNSIYNSSDWTDSGVDSAETLGNRLKAFGSAVSNNILDNDDYNSFATLGGSNLNSLFKQPEEVPKEEEEEEEEVSKEEEANKAIQDTLTSNRDSGDSYYSGLGLLKPNMDLGSSQTLKNYNSANPINWASYSDRLEGDQLQDFSNRFHGYFTNIKAKDLENQQFKENGWYYLPESLDEASGSIMRFNGTRMEKVPLSTFSKGRKYLSDKVLQSKGLVKKWEYNTGGVIKAQQGWYVDNTANVEKTLFSPKKEKEKEKEVTNLATNKSTTKTRPKEFSQADYVRLGSLTGDIASLVASMSGVGAPVSAALGVGATAANQTADMMEGQTFMQSLWNNKGSYALDALSLVPFAKAAKVPSMIKTLSRFAPHVIGAIGVGQGVMNSKEYLASWNKVTSGESLSIDDWRNIMGSLQIVAGTASTAHIASKGASRTKAAMSNEEEWLKTAQGWRKVPKPTVESVRRATTLDAQNKALEGTDIILPESKNWLGKGKGVAKVKTTDFYDFDKPVTTYSGDLPLEHKFNSGEKALGNLQLPNIKIPGLRNAYNAVIHPQASKRAKTSREVKSPESPESSGMVIVDRSSKPSESAEFRVDANEVAAKQTIPAHTPIADMFIPKRPVTKAAKAANVVKEGRTYKDAIFVEPSRSSSNLPAIRPKTQLPMLEKFLPKTQAKVPSDIVNRQIELTSKKIAEQIVKRQTKPGKPIKRIIDSSIFKGSVNHGRRAKELQATFDAPVEMIRVESTPKVKDEPYVSRSKSKSKSKSKSSSRKNDNKGYVNKKADGGVIDLFLDGGRPRIKAKDTSKWNRDTFMSNYDFGADVDNYLKTGNLDTYIAAFNGGEDIYDQLITKTGDYFGDKYNYSVQDPLAKQRQVTFRDTNRGFDDALRSSIVGYGDTEGKDKFDVFSGDRTGNRTFRGLNANQTARFNDQLSSRGAELYDKGNGNYRIRKVQAQALPEVTVTAKNLQAPQAVKDAPGSSMTGGDRKDVTSNGKFSVVPEDALALGRMVSGLVTNNRAAAKYKEGLKPNLMSTFENYVPVQGNYQAKNAAYTQAGNLESLANRPFTSDASLQKAGQLEAAGRAGSMRMQGDMADADMFYRTRMLGQQESDAAKARRVEVGNRNMASMNQIDAAKAQIDSARMTANYAQVLAPYLAGVENQFRQSKAVGRQVEMEAQGQQAMSEYDSRLANLRNKFATWKQTNVNGTEDEFATTVGAEDLKNAKNKYQQSILNIKRSSAVPWLFNRGITSNEKGGKLTKRDKERLQQAKDFNKRLLADNKQFHKDIMESKREHAKLLISMSSLTSELIKRGMS